MKLPANQENNQPVSVEKSHRLGSKLTRTQPVSILVVESIGFVFPQTGQTKMCNNLDVSPLI
jgi:hypothetical protein